jgi:hypothetical protein
MVKSSIFFANIVRIIETSKFYFIFLQKKQKTGQNMSLFAKNKCHLAVFRGFFSTFAA